MVILSQDDGKRVRVSSGSTDYDTAQRELTKRMGQVDRGEVIDTRRGPTCGDLWQGLERHYRIQKRKSTECLPRRWKHLQPTFGEIAAGQVTYDRLEQYIDVRLSEQASNATINRELSALGARQLRRAGVPESVVQAIGGWKTAATFKRYAIVSNADQREAMEKLEQARENNSSRHSLGHSSTENEATTIPGGSGKVQ